MEEVVKEYENGGRRARALARGAIGAACWAGAGQGAEYAGAFDEDGWLRFSKGCGAGMRQALEDARFEWALGERTDAEVLREYEEAGEWKRSGLRRWLRGESRRGRLREAGKGGQSE